jgi:NAD(P)H-dependent FMN reductase
MGGNTDILLQQVGHTFERQGGRTDALYLRDYRIEHCRGCFTCLRQSERPCVQRDDLDGLYDRLLGADALVLGTPVYFAGVSGLMKNFLDRWFPFGDFQKTRWARAFSGKPFGVLMVHADKDPVASGVEPAYRQLLSVVECTGGQVVGFVHGPANDPGEISGLPEVLEAAGDVGVLLYGLLNCR